MRVLLIKISDLKRADILLTRNYTIKDVAQGTAILQEVKVGGLKKKKDGQYGQVQSQLT